jgi:PAP2 superfamily
MNCFLVALFLVPDNPAYSNKCIRTVIMNIERRNLLLAGIAAPTLAACSGADSVLDTSSSAQSLDIAQLGQSSQLDAKHLTGVYQKSQALLWNEVVIQAVRSGTLGPPMVARALAIVHTAMYDAWAPFDAWAVASIPGATKRFRRSRSAAETHRNKEIAISYAAYRTLLDLYPGQSAFLTAQMQARGLDANDVSQSAETPQGVGNAAAAILLEMRHRDGSNQLGDLHAGAYTDYTGYQSSNSAALVNDPNHWQPMTFSSGATPGFLVPHWGKVTPFAMSSGDAMRPAVNLPQFGSQAYRDQALEVLNMTANLTEKQKVIAEYWANGPRTETPPGHWCLFAQEVAQQRRHSLDTDVRLFMALGNAMLDASICCWDAKRAYDYVRPITAIRTLFANEQVAGFRGPGQGVGLMLGSQWSPFQPGGFITPPFAEFTSGHSTFSAAGAGILQLFTGSDRFEHSVSVAANSLTTDPVSPREPVVLSWPTFTSAAREAGDSRMLGGIHFRNGNEYGLSMGAALAPRVALKSLKLFLGYR